MSIDQRVKEIIAVAFDAEVEDLQDDDLLGESLGADPYDLEELAAQLAAELEVEFDNEEVELWAVVSDIVQSVLDKVEE